MRNFAHLGDAVAFIRQTHLKPVFFNGLDGAVLFRPPASPASSVVDRAGAELAAVRCPDDPLPSASICLACSSSFRLGARAAATTADNPSLGLELPSRRYCWRGVPASPVLRRRLDRYRATAWRS